MLTRRRFLGHTALGMLAAAGGCMPQNVPWLIDQEQMEAGRSVSLAAKAGRASKKDFVLGYPVNMTTPPDDFFSWRKQLRQVGVGSFAYNNVGNPFRQSFLEYNTHDIEREVILRFGDLLGFARRNVWGFVSHSGTDSNMHGMYMGRTILKGRTGLLPKAYFTREAHYSVQILRDLLGLETVMVGTQPDGSMDPEDLKRKLADNAAYPALVVATVGTTFKGAIDPVDPIRKVLQGRPAYLHLDAALFGGYLPYSPYAADMLHRPASYAETGRYDSVAVSCHKFFGFPAPAGLFVTTGSNFAEFNELFKQVHNPEYIHQVPGTITCSRDAVKPAEFYFFSTPAARSRLTEAADSMLQRAAYLLDQMEGHFPHLLPARASNRSNTIYFEKPANWVVRKYSLATIRTETSRENRSYAHVVVMPHASMSILDEFLSDLKKGPSKPL